MAESSHDTRSEDNPPTIVRGLSVDEKPREVPARVKESLKGRQAQRQTPQKSSADNVKIDVDRYAYSHTTLATAHIICQPTPVPPCATPSLIDPDSTRPRRSASGTVVEEKSPELVCFCLRSRE